MINRGNDKEMSQKGSISSPKHFLLADIARTCFMPMTFCMAFLSDGSVTFPGQRGHAYDIFCAPGSEMRGKCPRLDKFLRNFRYISEPLKEGVARRDASLEVIQCGFSLLHSDIFLRI